MAKTKTKGTGKTGQARAAAGRAPAEGKGAAATSEAAEQAEGDGAAEADDGGHGDDAHGGGGGHGGSSFDDNIRLGEAADRMMKLAGGIGAVALVASIGLGVSANDGLAQFSFSYLVAFMFVLALGLGALWWVTLQHLVNARWSVVVRRVGEIFAANMPVVALLSLPIVVPMFMGNHVLYEWTDHAKVHADHLLHHKAGYLNLGFFGARLAFYFGFWVVLSRFFLNKSVAQDQSGDKTLAQRLQAISAPGMILVALTLTFASIDFVMSLDARWFSTIFGVYFFAGAVISFNALMALTVFWLQGQGRLVKSVTPHHFHDLGKMMFAFTVFWAYIAFSQFMLIWYANIPEETAWYKLRFEGDWRGVSAFLLVCHFAIPFLGLLSRHVKRHRKGLAFWAVWLLVMEYVDLYWLIMPTRDARLADGHGAAAGAAAHVPHLPVHLLDFTCLVATVGIFLAGAAYSARNLNLVPVKDPRLAKSLAFTNI